MPSIAIFVVLCFLTSFCSHAQEAVSVEVYSISKLFPRFQHKFDLLERGDLIVLDLDNTVFREDHQLGTDEWYSHRLNQLTGKGLSRRSAQDELKPLNFRIKSAARMRLLEKSMPEVISRMQARGVRVIGLTARHPELANLTIKQLKELGIDFGLSNFPHKNLENFHPPHMTNDFSWLSGVAFTDGSPKGMALQAILEHTSLRPLRAIAIDDRIYHVHTLTEAFLELKINASVVHYTHVMEESFNADIADHQLKEFEISGTIPSDEEAFHQLSICEAELTAQVLYK